MAQALESANVLKEMAIKEMAKNRDPSLLKFQDENGDETELVLIDRRYSTTTYGDIDGKIICKLVYPDGTINALKKSATKEVEFQNKAAAHNLGPKIYNHGFSGDSIPFTGFYEYDDDNDGERKRIPFPFANPFYYITMEYYSKKNGWKGPVYVVSKEQLDSKLSNNDLFYNFIYKLIFEAEIANILDPIEHFYYHPVHGLRMIDYGRCIDCKTIIQKQSALNEMMKSLEINEKTKSPKKSPRSPMTHKSRSPRSPMTHKSRNRSPRSPMTHKSRSPRSPMTHKSRNRSQSRSLRSPMTHKSRNRSRSPKTSSKTHRVRRTPGK